MILLLLLVLQTFLWFQMENYVCVREKTTRKRQKNSVRSFWFGNLVENKSKWKKFWSEIHKYSSVTIQSIVEEKILKFQNDQRTFRNNSILNHPFWICACYVVCVESFIACVQWINSFKFETALTDLPKGLSGFFLRTRHTIVSEVY